MDNNIITIEDVRKLLEFKPEEALVTSFYLNVDPAMFLLANLPL